MGRARPAYVAVLGAEGVAASTAYVLVDLSDVTNFPHAGVNELHLLGLVLNAEKHTDGAFDVWVGVVTENDETDGSVSWVFCFHLEHVANPTDSTDRLAVQQVDFTLGGAVPEGVNLAVVGGEVTRLITNLTQADNVNWQNDTGLASPAGAAGGAMGKPGVGDLVVWVEETAGAGTLDFCLTGIYGAA